VSKCIKAENASIVENRMICNRLPSIHLGVEPRDFSVRSAKLYPVVVNAAHGIVTREFISRSPVRSLTRSNRSTDSGGSPCPVLSFVPLSFLLLPIISARLE
jgi:hypothetical protein